MSIVGYISTLSFAPPHHGRIAVVAYRLGRTEVEVAVGLVGHRETGEAVWREPWSGMLDEDGRAAIRSRIEREADALLPGARLA